MTPEEAPSHPPEAEVIAGLLEKLDKAGLDGIGSSQLLPEEHEALQRLEQGGLAVLDQRGSVRVWFAPRHAPGVETAMRHLRDSGKRHGPVAWRLAELRKLLPQVLRPYLIEALISLEQQGEARELRSPAGVRRCWVFPKAIHSESTVEPISPSVLTAYSEWKHTSGNAVISIADLQRLSGVPLPLLHEWLLSESESGRAELSEGDWMLAPPDQREAALRVGTQKFVRVRFDGLP